MTISDNYVPNVNQGNGVTTVFTGSWSPLTSAAMRVYLRLRSTLALTTLVLDTDYTLTFSDAGYSVTILTPPSSLYDVVRARVTPVSQADPYKTAQGFQGKVLENIADKLTAIMQELDDSVARSAKFAVGSTSSTDLPEPVSNYLLGWNSGATALENKVITNASTTVISAFIGTLLDDSTATEARSTLSAAKSGANTDITSLASPAIAAATATTQSGGDSTTKVATTAFVQAALPIAATQAEMEAASSTTVFVTPGREKYHPGVAKSWVAFNGTGTIALIASFGIASIADLGVGQYSITQSVAFSSATAYAVVSSTEDPGQATSANYRPSTGTKTASVFFLSNAAGGALTDSAFVCAAFFGDQ